MIGISHAPSLINLLTPLVGASLLAMTAFQSPTMSTVSPLSSERRPDQARSHKGRARQEQIGKGEF